MSLYLTDITAIRVLRNPTCLCDSPGLCKQQSNRRALMENQNTLQKVFSIELCHFWVADMSLVGWLLAKGCVFKVLKENERSYCGKTAQATFTQQQCRQKRKSFPLCFRKFSRRHDSIIKTDLYLHRKLIKTFLLVIINMSCGTNMQHEGRLRVKGVVLGILAHTYRLNA